jgi:hypothetical protein
LIDEAQIRLMHERCRLQRMVAALAVQVGCGTAPEVLIDDGHETVGRPRLARGPCAQQGRELYIVSHCAFIIRQNGGLSPDFSRPS